jgi:hypothetical protein
VSRSWSYSSIVFVLACAVGLALLPVAGLPYYSLANLLEADLYGYTTGVESPSAAPGKPVGLSIEVHGPHPFLEILDFSVDVGGAARVETTVYDVLGRTVASLPVQWATGAGPLGFHWSGRDLDGRPTPRGIYFLRVTAGHQTANRTIIRLR